MNKSNTCAENVSKSKEFRLAVTNEVVKQVAGLLDVELGEDDISISHRLPPIPPWTDKDGIVHSPPLSIIGKFVKRHVKEKFYRARYKLKTNH